MVELLKREPVRVYLYSVLGVILAGLVGLGYVQENLSNTILQVLAVVLAVPAVEAARRKVTPGSTVAFDSDEGDDIDALEVGEELEVQ